MKQYDIWYKGTVIESTGYFSSLADAKRFARQRYGKDVEIEACYPPAARDGIKHKV